MVTRHYSSISSVPLYYCTFQNIGYGLTPQSLDTEEKQVRFYHILNEVFKFAYAKRSALGDEYDSQTEKNQDIEKVIDETSELGQHST